METYEQRIRREAEQRRKEDRFYAAVMLIVVLMSVFVLPILHWTGWFR